jgi:2-polyprenyl-3-methyl-5-hydroxy-6-metoxy-1,4-benzoquinol methylase
MIASWSDRIDGAGMADDLLVGFASLVARHPWWRARTRLVLAHLRRLGIRPPARVLDVGCSWRVVLDAPVRSGYDAAGLDASHAAPEGLDRPGRSLVHADLTRDFVAPDPVDPFDAVLALDVIDHLDDDRAAVARLTALVRSGGALILSVPARPELWSAFDEAQGHRRRYTPESLSLAFQGSGLVPSIL